MEPIDVLERLQILFSWGLLMLIYDIHNLVTVYPAQSQLVNDRITLQIYQGEIFGNANY